MELVSSTIWSGLVEKQLECPTLGDNRLELALVWGGVE
jgi:hypothetical protein